jgi:CTP synthase (UTP-ammonia lyase)
VRDIDILFAQEVTSPETTNIGEYETHHNIGSSMRGTAIFQRTALLSQTSPNYHQDEQLQLKRGTLLINIYAPSGTSKRHEREYFFNNELTYLLRPPTARMIIGGNFNGVIVSDTTGHYNHSPSLPN